MNSSTYLFESEKIGTAMFRLALPSVLISVIDLIYNLINQIYIGWLDNTAMIAAISLTSTISLFIYALGEAVGIGASSYLGRELGAKHEHTAPEVVRTSFTSGIIGAVFLTGLGLLCLKPYIAWQTPDTEVQLYAFRYGIITVGTTIILVLRTVIIHLLRSVGDIKFPMYVLTGSVFLNIILDPLFMFDFGLNMGIYGAAFATALSQLATLILCLMRISRKGSLLYWRIGDFHIDKTVLKEIVKVGSAVYVRNALPSIASMIFTKMTFRYGTDFTAGCSVGKHSIHFVNFFIQGVANGFLPFAAFNYGAKSYRRLWDSIKLILKVLTGYSLLAALFLFCFSSEFISLFTPNVDAIGYGAKYLQAYGLSLPIYALYYILTVTLQAAGKGKESMLLSMSRQGLIYIPLILILPYFFDQTGIYYSQPLSDWLTVAMALLISAKLLKEIYQKAKTPDTNKQPEAAE